LSELRSLYVPELRIWKIRTENFMKTFRIQSFQVALPQLTKKVRFVSLTDLHGLVYGENNGQILSALRKLQPDAVLVVGDMSVNYDKATYKDAAKLLKGIAAEFPVVYTYGNHETRMKKEEPAFLKSYEAFLEKNGVILLHNDHARLCLAGVKFVFYGLELPLVYYKKPFAPKLTKEALLDFLGEPEKEGVRVLLAHSPKYGKLYFQWGADLIFSGHYHGGAVRFSKHCGLVSPQFRMFPSYCCGDFHREEQHMFVSAGMGEHTIPIRIHNPRELVTVDVVPAGKGL